MSLLHYNYHSEILGYYVNITVALPTRDLSLLPAENTENRPELSDEKKQDYFTPGMKFQTLYLIHGGGDEDTLPYRYTNIERYAEEKKLMVVTPGIPNSFGADAMYGVSYFSFLTKELPVVIQSLFPSSPLREDNFVAGFAMGGNVALAMGIVRPDLYQTCVDMSGGIGYTLCTDTLVEELKGDHFKNRFYRYNATFGDPETFPGSKNDLYPIAKKHKEDGDELCDFYILCGTKEFIRERVEGDVAKLRELQYPVTYISAEGYDHDFRTWDHFLEVAVNEWLPLKNRVLYPEK